jgi:hypothetical protein
MNITKETVETQMLEDELRAVLADKEGTVVGAALGLIAATSLAGMAPEMRQEARDMLVKLVDDLVPIIVNEMIADGRLPPSWRGSVQ